MDNEQPREQEDIIKQRMEKREKLNRAYLAVFSSPEGQLVLQDLMTRHGFINAHPVETNEMFLKEGERTVVLRILQILQTNPQQIVERLRDEVF